MSTDPLGEALGSAEAPTAAQPGSATGQPQPGPAPGPGGTPHQAPPAYEPSPAYDAQPAQPAWEGPQPERSLLERRPEILVGAAMAGGFIAAQLLGRIRGR